jgi:hypothetical protein
MLSRKDVLLICLVAFFLGVLYALWPIVVNLFTVYAELP